MFLSFLCFPIIFFPFFSLSYIPLPFTSLSLIRSPVLSVLPCSFTSKAKKKKIIRYLCVACHALTYSGMNTTFPRMPPRIHTLACLREAPPGHFACFHRYAFFGTHVPRFSGLSAFSDNAFETVLLIFTVCRVLVCLSLNLTGVLAMQLCNPAGEANGHRQTD